MILPDKLKVHFLGLSNLLEGRPGTITAYFTIEKGNAVGWGEEARLADGTIIHQSSTIKKQPKIDNNNTETHIIRKSITNEKSGGHK